MTSGIGNQGWKSPVGKFVALGVSRLKSLAAFGVIATAILSPSVAMASAACDAINAGALNHSAEFVNGDAISYTGRELSNGSPVNGIYTSGWTGNTTGSRWYSGSPYDFAVGDTLTFNLNVNTSAGTIQLNLGTSTNGTGFATTNHSSSTTITRTFDGTQRGYQTVLARSTGVSPATGTIGVVVSCAAAPPAPTVTSISPTAGPTAGGTSVMITGTNFSDVTGVKFGATTATYAVNSTTSITATSPASSSGTVDITVTTTGGTSVTSSSDQFTYISAPTISGLSTGVGPVSGGKAVVITGTNFSNATAVTFGGTLAPFTINSATQITTITPNHSAGVVDIVVTSPGGSATIAGGFTYATVPDAPVIGSATAGNGQAEVSFTAPSNNGGSSIIRYTATSSPGGFTGTATASPVIVTGLTNGTAYTFTVTATNEIGTGNASAASNATTPFVLSAPVVGPVAATVANSSSNNPITLDLSGDAATSVAIVVQATNGTATATGTSISYTPNVGYTGPDSFTYTATNAAGTSAPATASITVTAPPTLTLSPPSGALPAAMVGTAYSQAITASGGISTYAYAIVAGALPTGLTLNLSTGLISGTPTAAMNSVFTVSARDTSNFTVTASYSITISALQAPVANNSSATVAANSSGNPIMLSLSGGTATSVFVVTQGNDGTAAASGTSVTYTPNAGFSGSDSFTYTVTNAAGTSAAATVSVTVSPPTLVLSPASGALPGATAGTAYSQTITASGGGVPYSYAVVAGALPPNLTLATSGVIAGIPTTSGNSSFTIQATDSFGATASANYSISVAPAATNFTFLPVAGSLPDAMAEEDYSQQISATGGSGALTYQVLSGALPDGLVLNVSTGELTGPLAAGSEGNYSFTIQVRDATGATGTATYALRVGERTVTVTDRVITVPPGGTPNNIDLTKGATGGPFVAADIASVQPANVGTLSIVNGEFAQVSGPTPTGWYLKFVPNPAYSGQVVVRYRLTSAAGVSNLGTITYSLGYDAGKVAADIDALVHGFVQSRQNLIASTIKVPGLLERRRQANATDPVTARMMPSANGMVTSFSTSLQQMEAASNRVDGASNAELSPFNIWIDGTFMMHNRDQNGSRWGSFGMVSAGADYLLSDRALLGFSFHFDRMTDPTKEDTELVGNGWLVGPYTSFEIGKGVFWDASLLYGGSANDIDTAFWDGSFDTRRWLLDTSIKGEWALDEDTTLTPKLRAVYFSETVDDYAVGNSNGDTLEIGGFREEQFRVSLGAEIARQFTLENGSTLTPALELTGGFSGLDGNGAFGSVGASASLQTVDEWLIDFSLLFNIEEDGQTSAGAKIGISATF